MCFLCIFNSFYNKFGCFVICKNYILFLKVQTDNLQCRLIVFCSCIFVLEILIYQINKQHSLIFLQALYLSFLLLVTQNDQCNLYTLSNTLFQFLFQFLLVLLLIACFSCLILWVACFQQPILNTLFLLSSLTLILILAIFLEDHQSVVVQFVFQLIH